MHDFKKDVNLKIFARARLLTKAVLKTLCQVLPIISKMFSGWLGKNTEKLRKYSALNIFGIYVQLFDFGSV